MNPPTVESMPRWFATFVERRCRAENVDPLHLWQTLCAMTDEELLAHSEALTSVDAAGAELLPIIEGEIMTETPLPNCQYNVQAFPEDDPHKCGKKAVKHVKGMKLDMRYCISHWRIAKERASQLGEVTNLCNHSGVCPLREGGDHTYNVADGQS